MKSDQAVQSQELNEQTRKKSFQIWAGVLELHPKIAIDFVDFVPLN